MGIKWIIR